MSNSRKRYQAVQQALYRLYPIQPSGRVAVYLNTLAAMISGIIGGKSAQLPKIAEHVPGPSMPDSQVKRFSRWIQNEKITHEICFMPYARLLLASLAHLPLVLVIDGSVVGRGCVALMVGLVYKGRCLPLAWMVTKGKKGHFPEAMHIELISTVEPLIPEGSRVVLLGDGEFDGVNLQAIANGWGWEYVVRTAKNIVLTLEDHEFTFSHMGERIGPGEDFDAPGVLFSEKLYGPVLAIAWWRKDCKEPIYLVTNMTCAEEACRLYSKRFRIETFFSDQKSRGFHLQNSHLSDPERLSRLMIAACLAYYWIIYLGVMAVQYHFTRILHRKNRCDLSLFQLGLRFLIHLLKHSLPLPLVLEWAIQQNKNETAGG